MATLIICPVCDTRYETKAVFPPEGRKVRCSKCSHVWQAQPVAAPEPPAPMAPRPQAQPQPAPAARPPQPPPAPPPADPAPRPRQSPAEPPAGGPEASTRTVQNLLFVLGGVLLGTAAVVFTAVAWTQFGVGGRAAILGVLTLLALAAPAVALDAKNANLV